MKSLSERGESDPEKENTDEQHGQCHNQRPLGRIVARAVYVVDQLVSTGIEEEAYEVAWNKDDPESQAGNPAIKGEEAPSNRHFYPPQCSQRLSARPRMRTRHRTGPQSPQVSGTSGTSTSSLMQ